MTEPGWYPDPMQRHQLRWFSTEWTDNVSDGTSTSVDPLHEAPTADAVQAMNVTSLTGRGQTATSGPSQSLAVPGLAARVNEVESSLVVVIGMATFLSAQLVRTFLTGLELPTVSAMIVATAGAAAAIMHPWDRRRIGVATAGAILAVVIVQSALGYDDQEVSVVAVAVAVSVAIGPSGASVVAGVLGGIALVAITSAVGSGYTLISLYPYPLFDLLEGYIPFGARLGSVVLPFLLGAIPAFGVFVGAASAPATSSGAAVPPGGSFAPGFPAGSALTSSAPAASQHSASPAKASPSAMNVTAAAVGAGVGLWTLIKWIFGLAAVAAGIFFAVNYPRAHTEEFKARCTAEQFGFETLDGADKLLCYAYYELDFGGD